MVRPRRESSQTGPLLTLAGVILTLYFAREVLVPLVLAVTLSFLLTPLVTGLEKLRVGRISAVLIVVTLSLGALGGVAYVVARQLLDVANELPRYRVNIRDKVADLRAPSGGAIGKAAQTVKEIGKELSATSEPAKAQPKPQVGTRGPSVPLPKGQPNAPTPVVIETPQNDLAYFRELLTPLVAPLGMAGVVLVFTVFILIKKEDLRNRIFRLVGLAQLSLMTTALDDGAQRISRYVMMQFLVNGVYGVLFGLALFFIGVPNATLWGVIAAVLRIIPYVGSLSAAILPLVLSLAVFKGWMPPALVFGSYVLLEGITGNFVEPWLYGAHTGVSSLALLVTTVFWTLLWGWPGLILSTPLTVCVIVLGRYVPQWSFLHVLLGDEIALSPHAHYYQRLLAMDSAEARTVADAALKGHALVELYDGVLLPALCLAEQDRHKGVLDDTREAFLFLSATEMIAEMSEYKLEAETSGIANPEGVETVGSTETGLSHTSRIVCIPANDQADEISASMLAQLVEQAGYVVLSFPVNTQWDEAIKSLALGESDVICISAIPPFAFTHARAVCQRARSLAPSARILVGMWGFSGDLDKLKQRFGAARVEQILTTMAAAVAAVRASGGLKTESEPELAPVASSRS